MSKFSGLAEAFEKNTESKTSEELTDKAPADDVTALRRSLAVISAIEKMQNAGVPVTKKAKMDYLLALRFVDQASRMSGTDLYGEYMERQQLAKRSGGGVRTESVAAPVSSPVPEPAKRNPRDNPEEFRKALESSRGVVEQVERMQAAGQAVPARLMETCVMCRKFLKKYSS